MKIHWGDFIKRACEEYPKEVCALLVAKHPFAADQEWFVLSVKNVSENPKEEWMPDPKEWKQTKKGAAAFGHVFIGNVHSHPIPPKSKWHKGDDLNDVIKHFNSPSKTDLKFAQKYNDIIRGIMVVGKDKAYDVCWHDKFGNKIAIVADDE